MGKTASALVDWLTQSRTAVCLFLATAVFLCFSPALRNGFTGYDDPEYVTDNVHVTTGLTGRNIAWAFTSSHASNWHPLTWISHDLDCALYGLWPAGHHLTSLLLHIANTVLLFLWLSRAAGGRARSAFVALAFGLHPLHVESVAWIAERKDVLSTFFGILTLLSYGAWVKRPTAARYCLVAGLFAASLLSKPMLVTMPLLLLLLDWWPLGRSWSWRLAMEKIPLAILSALSCAVTLWAQRQGGSLVAAEQLPVSLRLANASVSYIRYLWKTAWPTGLSAFYPFPPGGIPAWQWTASLAAIAAISWLVFDARRRRPWLAAGWCWYLLTLLPVIGIVQVGMQAMADRYMYAPMIGLLIAIAWECAGRWHWSKYGGALLLALCFALAWRQAQVWKNGVTLFTHAIEVTGDNFVAQDNLGVELDRLGLFDAALPRYRETLRIKPGDRHGEENYAQANFAKGERLLSAGKLEEALASFREGLRYRPLNFLAHAEAGRILTEQRRLTEATGEFRLASEIDPNNIEAHYNLGVALALLGQNAEALRSYEAALRLNPAFGPAHLGRIISLFGLARYEEAQQAVLAAQTAHVEIDPGLASAIAAKLPRSPDRRKR